jgi:FkbM family methyltransferase
VAAGLARNFMIRQTPDMSETFTVREVVRALYRELLRRDPDPDGLEYYVSLANSGHTIDDITDFLKSSPEYGTHQRQSSYPHDRFYMHHRQLDILQSQYDTLLEKLQPDFSFTIVDVGAQKLVSEEHVYSALCKPPLKHRIIGFEPLEDRALDRNLSDNTESTIYPVAICDGNNHSFFVNNEDATSSIFPLNKDLCMDFEHLHTLETVSMTTVQTKRLDDVLLTGSVEFLKLDIQGAEFLVLQNSIEVLGRTAVIHCEVEFDAIYKGQALFHDVQKFLTDHGFYLVDLIISHRYAYQNSLHVPGGDRLLWADAVYFRKTNDSRTLQAQAVIAALVYDKSSMAVHLDDRFERSLKEGLCHPEPDSNGGFPPRPSILSADSDQTVSYLQAAK